MTTTEPTSADDLIRAASAVMPEPGDASSLSASNGNADDLIARLADQQIDDLMGDEAPLDADAEAIVNGAIDAAADLSSVAQSLVAGADEELKEVSERSALALKNEAAAPPAPAEVAEAEVTIVAAAPSFNPPPHADLGSATRAEPLAQHELVDQAQATETSAADAVARELAADVEMLSTPLPSIIEHQAETKASSHRVWDVLLAIPMRVLEAINLPVKPMSDRGREVIGAIGVLTLVNAAGLLIYLAVFAHRHG